MAIGVNPAEQPELAGQGAARLRAAVARRQGERVPPRLSKPGQILAEAEVSRRVLLLAELHAAFTALGVRCVLSRKHRLVLRYEAGLCGPSGPLDPHLHIFTDGGTEVATTDGAVYSLASGGQYPVDDPKAVAAKLTSDRNGS
ncbi:MAG TPA: hypothetical protein VNF47_25620 [Streptosporangiaceae bacterium]|nr:hypothetical protein [Streptosporangiaceae bacterium]